MNQDNDSFTHVADQARKLCSATLAGSGELICFQLDCTEEFFNRNITQLRSMLDQASKLQAPEQWPGAVLKGIEAANALVRDTFVVAMDYQTKSFRMLQKIAIDTQELVYDAVSGQAAARQPLATPSQRGGRTIPLRQSAAA
jgi:hypothetical protein